MATPHCSTPVKLTEQRFVNLFVTTIQRKEKSSAWVFASRKKTPGVIGSSADAAVVVALLQHQGTNHLVLSREFRAPLGRHELSLPSGLIDDGETAAAAGAREFHEETGLTLSHVSHVSPPLSSSAGLTDETVSLVYGTAQGEVSRAFQTEHEDIEVILADLPKIQELLRGTSEVISSRLYPILVGFVTAGKLAVPQV